MTPPPFLDTNVLVRHITGDNPDHSPRATACLERIERGELTVRTTDTVVFETVYTLQRLYQMPRTEIRDALLPLLELNGIELPGKSSFRAVFDLYVDRPRLSFADCYHSVLMRRLGLTDILTFDEGFDCLPGITRQVPS